MLGRCTARVSWATAREKLRRCTAASLAEEIGPRGELGCGKRRERWAEWGELPGLRTGGKGGGVGLGPGEGRWAAGLGWDAGLV